MILAGDHEQSDIWVSAGPLAVNNNLFSQLSRGVSRQFSMTFSIWSLDNLFYRTRLKMAAGMLHFHDYGDFASYFGRAGIITWAT